MRTTAAAAIGLVGILVVGTAACGTDDEGADSGTTPDSTTTVVERADELLVELVGCHQAGFPTGIEPAAAEARVDDGQEVYLDDGGNARFTLISKDCEDLVVDGTSMGTGHFNTVWIRITGPDELRTIEGVPDAAVSPTDYFHPVAFQTDNAEFAEATADFGVPMTLASSMTMDPAAPGTMTGTVEDDDPDRPLSYRYTMDNTNEIPPGTQGVVHVLQGTDDGGDDLTYDIECPVEGGWFANPTTIEFDPGSAVEDLVGTGYAGVGPSPNLSCDVAISRSAG